MKWTYDKNIHTGVKWTYYFLSNTVTVTRSKTILTLVRWYYPRHSPYKYFDLWYANSINNIDIIKINYMTLFHDESSSITLMSPIFMILIYWQVKKVWFRINLKVLIYTHTPLRIWYFWEVCPMMERGFHTRWKICVRWPILAGPIIHQKWRCVRLVAVYGAWSKVVPAVGSKLGIVGRLVRESRCSSAPKISQY